MQSKELAEEIVRDVIAQERSVLIQLVAYGYSTLVVIVILAFKSIFTRLEWIRNKIDAMNIDIEKLKQIEKLKK